MAENIGGTNSDKIDKLITPTIELRMTVRNCFALIGVGLPMIVGLLTFLVVQSFSTSAQVDRLNDQIATIRQDQARLAERQERLERTIRP